MDENQILDNPELTMPVDEDTKQLKTVSEYCKNLSDDVTDFNVLSRFGEIIERCDRETLIKKFGRRRVFNFYDREEAGLQDIFITTTK